ncbi:MAG: hypothetical protein R3A47_05570 [Polyangiales bacterium]
MIDDPAFPPEAGALRRFRHRIGHRMGLGYARLMLGNRASDELQIPRGPWMVWPLFFAPPNFAFETARRAFTPLDRIALRIGTALQKDRMQADLAGRPAAYVPVTEVSAHAYR